jgi:starch synthase
MEEKYKIAMIASECFPYVKTGGLADVIGALPQAIKKLGHEVIVILPKYSSINVQQYNLLPLFSQMGVWMGNTQEWCAVDVARTEQGIPVYFIEFDRYFARDGIYNDVEFREWEDNPRRYAFFSRAGLQLCRDLGFKADIIHLHDWQTALAAAYLKVWHWNDAILGSSASVLTIHNIGYQGVFNTDSFDYIGLQWGNFVSDILEDHGKINFLKGGIHFADLVNTVSPTYALETRTPEYAHGMAPYLNNKSTEYLGILNGVDYQMWNPETDLLIPTKYSFERLHGKQVCKRALQQRMELEVVDDVPIIGIVSRFAYQKGLDLLASTIEAIINNMLVQIVILGSGERELESFFGELPSQYPGKIASYIGYSNELAHWIEAGSDFFLMPSRYEPCGLNQIYSLKYGTLPIVRNTGGLSDTVEQYDEYTGLGTGFKFDEPSGSAIYYAVGWAVSTYYDRPYHLKAMIQRAMAQKFSWEASARAYIAAYSRAINNKLQLSLNPL